MKVPGVMVYLMKRLTLNWQLQVRGGAGILSILIILEVWLLGILGEFENKGVFKNNNILLANA